MNLIRVIFSHINKTSTYEDPRKWGTQEPEQTPEPREVKRVREGLKNERKKFAGMSAKGWGEGLFIPVKDAE